MSATYEQAKLAQPTARAVFGKLVAVRTVSIVRAGTDGFGLRVDIDAPPPAALQFPDTVDGVPVSVCVKDDVVVAG